MKNTIQTCSQYIKPSPQRLLPKTLMLAALSVISPLALAHGELHKDATTAAEAAAGNAQGKAEVKTEVKLEQKDWGIAGVANKKTRTLRVDMGDDLRFSPERLQVKLGQTVKIIVRNKGQMLHEFVIGTLEENAKHAELMLKFPNMVHDEPYMAHVAPGETGELVWKFNRAGTFEFACLINGHYQAGMRGTIVVKP